MEKITIQWLAHKLQLSKATISKALRNSHEISEETKQRVWQLAAQMHYIPNPYATSLRRKSSKTIALVIPEVADSYFSQAINGIESIAQQKGYHVLIYLTHENVGKEQAILTDFASGRVDGVIMSVTAETTHAHHIQALLAQQIPVILFDRIKEEVPTIKIITNDTESGYIATKHLLERGCKHIAFLSISHSLTISQHRQQGYQQALLENGLTSKEVNVVLCTHHDDTNYEIIKRVLQQKNRPDALIASVEKLCTPVYVACQQLRLSIPGTIKVIGFSNVKSALILQPPLTTISQPAFEMGVEAATSLFQVLESKCYALPDETRVIPSLLTVRASTTN